MKLLIDADGCPVVGIAVELCKKYHLPCFLLCDTSHALALEGATTYVFDKGTDSVDYALVNRVSPGDIVITQDYGLASMCLSRNAKILHQDGWEYTTDNIDALLLVRHESRKFRASGGKMKGQKKRSDLQNNSFYQALEAMIQTSVHG